MMPYHLTGKRGRDSMLLEDKVSAKKPEILSLVEVPPPKLVNVRNVP